MRDRSRPHYPLYHFERRFVVELQAQILKPDGQMPTVQPPQFFGLEFTEKIAPHEALAIPPPIGVYRLDGAPRAQTKLTQLSLAQGFKYRQRSGRDLCPGAGPPLLPSSPDLCGKMVAVGVAGGRYDALKRISPTIVAHATQTARP
jgi:hypothetical protein